MYMPKTGYTFFAASVYNTSKNIGVKDPYSLPCTQLTLHVDCLSVMRRDVVLWRRVNSAQRKMWL